MNEKENKQGCLGCLFFIIIVVGLSMVFTDFMIGDTIYNGEVIVNTEENVKYEFKSIQSEGNVRDIWLKEDQEDLKEEYVTNFAEIIYNYYNRSNQPAYIVNVFLSEKYIEKDEELWEFEDEMLEKVEQDEINFDTYREKVEEKASELKVDEIMEKDFLIQAARNDNKEEQVIIWQQEEGKFSNLNGTTIELSNFETEGITEEDIIKRVMEE